MMFAAKPVRTLVALGLAAGLTLGAAACGTATAAGHLDQLQALAQSCPPEGTGLATYIGDDLSGSARDAAIESGRRAAIKAVATKTAVCGGHLRIDGFSSSVSASRVVFDGDLRPPGATQIAQLRKVDDLVKDTMPVIENGLQAAAAALQAFPGSDILGQFRLAEEYRQQLASTGPHRLEVHLLTDGEQSVNIDLTQPTLTTADATALANRLPVVSYPPGTLVELVGVGRVAGTEQPTPYVEALKTFYDNYCGRSGASCRAVTDYTEGS
jgi:hypothetical protein